MIDVFTGAGKPLRRSLLRAQKKIIRVYKLAGIYSLQFRRKCRFAGTAAPVYGDDQTIFSADMASMRSLILTRICSTLMSVLMFGALPEL